MVQGASSLNLNALSNVGEEASPSSEVSSTTTALLGVRPEVPVQTIRSVSSENDMRNPEDIRLPRLYAPVSGPDSVLSGGVQSDSYNQASLSEWVEGGPDSEWGDRIVAANMIQRSTDGCVTLRHLNITSLPEGLDLTSLSLEHCHSIQSLPSDLRVYQDLHIIGCRSFSSLAGLRLEGNADLFQLPSLQEWVRESSVRGNLTVRDCPVLNTLPFQLTVGENAVVERCRMVGRLSDRLHIGGSLSVRDCPNFSDLPFRSVTLGGDLMLENLPFMRELPGWIESLNLRQEGEPLRRIDFRNIAVPIFEQIEVRTRLTNVDVRIAHADGVPEGSGLLQLVQRWMNLSEQTYAGEAEQLVVGLPESIELNSFLQRLEGTREFQIDPKTLAKRVCKLLNDYVNNKLPHDQAMTIIHNMLSSCDDGIIRALQDLEIAGRVKVALDCPMPKVMLRDLGEDLMKLEAIQRATFELAERQLNRGQVPDEVEIYLRLETSLAGRLALPTQNRNMIFANRSFVSQADLDHVEQQVLDHIANPEERHAFFENWEPWQVLTRTEAVEQYRPTGQGSVAMSPELAEEQCPLSLERGKDLRKPVSIRNKTGIFELDDLLQWYKADGRHPVTHEGFHLDDIVFLRRLPLF